MMSFSIRSALIAAFFLSNCVTWTTSRHHYTHNVSGHRSRHRRNGQGLFLPASFVIPGGEGTGWGEWGEVSPCSRPCGGGVASQKRICLKIGSDDQPQCSGGDTKYFSCQTQDCPPGSPDFRAQQCSKYDDSEFRNIKYKWVPYTKAPNPCELNCMPQGERFYYRHQKKVADGTRCNEESFDVCVNGTCEPVGCDMMLGSSAREDKCRECRGNNANCQTIKGVHDVQDALNGYNDILIIPKGATSIVVEERAKSSNYLALRAHNGSYYLNGDYHIDFPRSFSIAGALWIYERSQLGFEAPDKLRCLGPTNEPLYLSLLLQGPNVGIDYEYSLPNKMAPPRNNQYNWVFGEFTACSAPCAGGFQIRNVTCRSRDELELVDDALCEKELKPPTNQSCNPDACAAEWTPGPWGKCSKRCGKGGQRSREVHCMQVINNGYLSMVSEKKCFDVFGEKPNVYEKCNENATCPLWFTGPWKPCSKLCDEGKQSRNVVCYQKNGNRIEKLADDECEDEKPATEQTCMLQPCDGVDWVTSEWSKCDSCLSKEQSRTAVCSTKNRVVVNDSFCAYHPTPILTRPCDKNELPPCDVQWYATQWSNCSVICGKGFQYRKVFCGIFDGESVLKVKDSRCSKLPKYNDTRECEIPKDKCPSQWFTGPWTACNETCGYGVRFRRVMCLANNVTATDCPQNTMPETDETCNDGSCEQDIGVAPDYEDYENCDEDVEEEENYEEAGLERDSSSTLKDVWSTMYSDSPTEGSGSWTLSTVEHESTFPDTEPTLTSEELLKTDITGSSSSDFTGIQETEDSTALSTSDENSTTEDSTGSTFEETTPEPGTTDSVETKSDTDGSEPTDDTTFDSTTESDSTDVTDESTVSEESSGSGVNVSGVTDHSTLKAQSKSIDDVDYDDYLGLSEDELRALGKIKKAISAIEASTPADVTEPEEAGKSKTPKSSLSTEGPIDLTTDVDSSTKITVTFYNITEEDYPDLTTESDKTTSESESSSEQSTEPGASTESVSTASDLTPESEDTDKTSESVTTEKTDTSASDLTTESGDTDETSDFVTTEITDISASDLTTESGDTDETSNSITTEITDTSPSDLTTESGNTDETSESVTTEITDVSASDLTTETGDTDETSESGTTEISDTSPSDVTTESGDTDETSESVSTDITDTSPSDVTTESGDTDETSESVTTEITDTSPSDVTTESGDTDETSESVTSEITNTSPSDVTTESGDTDETSESVTTEITDTSPSDVTTESGDTDETSESVTTEITDTSPSDVTTESGDTDETSESVTTEITDTSPSDVTTESGDTDETSESVTTEITDTSPSDVTTESGDTDETSESVSTESGSSTTEVSEITEPSVTEESTPKGSTEDGETTIPSSDEIPTTTEESTTAGRTLWNKSTTVEVFKIDKPRVCRPRSCKRSKFGCCPDQKTPALGPFDQGCSKPLTCKESTYSCCPDGLSPAKGPDNEGCPVEPCAETLFGCCQSDNTTSAQGNDQEGCPPPPPACLSTEFGCCLDGEGAATGPDKEGCPETSTTATPQEDVETSEPSTSSSLEVTEADICAGFEFGCCFDNKTAAAGPDKQGCPCDTSDFGCCPDGVSAAQGPEFEGCVKTCNDTAHGCCNDNKTPAHGPDYEGCCLIYPYGCCPDSYTPARGPHLEGCACQDSRYGCCPDNVTVATGHDNQGCGCQYTQHGCCPDRHSEASGPEYEGCLCHTYQFGCCPDGVTTAEGPRGQGCYCQQSKYGCCSDDQTHAKGPNKEGCSCATSRHGCCLDGTTEAIGPKFQGCPDKPENKQAACGLPFERGTCQNFAIKWYYDAEYGGCSRFWYGGCEGNGNRFSSKEECEDVCVSPAPKDACKLPQIKGSCTNYHERWYYDNERDMCSYFIYSGCLGNNNNFETQELCQSQCEPEKTTDQCKLPLEQGSCNGNYPRWGYNKDEKRCEQFVWGGCEGNSNRFSTEAACLLRCDPPGEPKPECSEPQEVGNCTETEAVWSFSQSENHCVPFYYTGCGGNGNKYNTREDCEDACPSAFVPELCALPASTGDCADYRQKWYFDTTYQRCRQFYYGGCGGNGNKFDSEEECAARCSAITTPAPTPAPAPAPQPAPAEPPSEPSQGPDLSEICFMDLDSGPCNITEPKWGYDYLQGKCVRFPFGGCGGNQNNFPTEDDCAAYCRPTQDLCQLPMLSGPCDESLMSWFYDASTDSCSQFTYGGCDGNDNRFNSREECESRCKTGPGTTSSTPATTLSTPTPTTVKVDRRFGESIPEECVISETLEACSPNTRGELWYYEPSARACVAHNNLEAGDQCRTVGVFYSQEACERACGAFRNIDVCQYQKEDGPCHERISKYYYNTDSRRCEEFLYGGCFGSPNRFSTEQECEQICMANIDPCTLPAEMGNCLNHIVLWYYDQATDQCNQFVFGGCGGNENKFESRESCEGRCRRQRPGDVTTVTPTPPQVTRQPEQEECRTPASLDPCGANITVFYYNEATRTCDPADFGGCRYRNSYRSEEECERRCGAFKDIEVCRYGLDPGPCSTSITKFYFDAASGSCRSYAYGGCQGGPNRFSTIEECEEVCSAAGPDRACLQEPSVGSQCGAVPERRWHYDVERRDCLVFAYQGCGGNHNNFLSYEECADLCRVAPSDSEQSKICSQYAEECSVLETSCYTGVRVVVAAEGCERCLCPEPLDCEPQRRECEALRCRFGVEKIAQDEACEKCKCFEDPCIRSNCSSSERCVVAPYRDSNTQETLYSAHCVPDVETNEVVPDCSEYKAECGRIQCPYSVQVTRTSHGCERCTCVPQEVDCAPLEAECDKLRCTYGATRSHGDDGCVRCKCLERPCDSKKCPSGTRCIATPFKDPVTQESKYSTDCETINKPGQCPYIPSSEGNTPSVQVCTDDADCRGILKCCSQVCLVPEEPTPIPIFTTHTPDIPHAPQASVDTEPAVAAAEGGKATLRCIFHGNPPPRITWRFGEITIDSDVDRYRLLSDGALEIVSLYRNDSGVYICVASNDLGTAEQEITLQVHDPVEGAAGIAGEAGAAVTGELDSPVTLRCLAYGYPPPAIYWFRGGSMVPFSDTLYEARGQELLIRRLSLETLGEYLCQAYTGFGSAATMTYRVQAYRPSDDYDPGNEYLVPRVEAVVAVTPRAPAARPPPALTTAVVTQLYTENVSTRLLPATTSFSVGAQVNLPCEVHGYPEPRVYWTKDNVELASSGTISISDARLTIKQAQVSDSGLYGCHAANAYTSHSSTVQIIVQERQIPAKCIDNPTFAKCTLIVQGRFCQHPYYSKFCCKSCVEAGQLDPRDAEMLADEAYRK